MFFPILKIGPNAMDFTEETPFDPTLRTEFEHGPPLTRSRTTSVLRIWNIVLNELSQDDKETIDSFQRDETNFGAGRFEWENTQDRIVYVVRFLTPIRFRITSEYQDPRSYPNKWMAEFKLYGKEAVPMYILKSENVDVSDLAAGADLTDWPLFVVPSAVTLRKIGILTRGSPAAVDDSNTVVITIKDGNSNTIVTKTYNTATQPPSSDYEDLGDLSNVELAAGEHVTLSVVQGTNANMPAFVIALEFSYTV